MQLNVHLRTYKFWYGNNSDKHAKTNPTESVPRRIWNIHLIQFYASVTIDCNGHVN